MAVPVVPELSRIPGVAATGLAVGDRVSRVAVADQDHRRTPVAGADPTAGEGVTEHRHQRSVGRPHRGAEIRAGSPEVVGDPRAGEVFDLADGYWTTKSVGSTDRVHVQ